jgi:dTDP-4-dehydrorhamnose reductase
MMPPIRMVVTGTQGQIALSLLESGPRQGFEVLAVGRPSLQLTDPRTVEPAIAAARPHIVVSAAAYTDIEGAEVNPPLAEAVNAQGAEAIAICTRKLGIPLIHLSTAYVFDGTSKTPYRESDAANPLNAYGRSKENGERAVAAAQPAHVVLRTSLVNSPFKRNFAESILLRASRQSKIPVVTDQLVSPTAASDLAEGILAVARNLLQGMTGDRGFGTFHMSSTGAITPMELAEVVLRRSAERGGPTAGVVPIKLADYVSRVRRPPNVTLDCSKLASIYGIRLPDWRASIDACVDRLIERLK